MSSETDFQSLYDLIIFMTIGDGSICKPDSVRNCYLEITHSKAQLEYLKWKISLLENFGIKCGKLYFRKDKSDVRVRTERNEIFNIIEKRMYLPNRKKVLTKRILRRLTPLGLAIWYMDDGSAKISHPKWRKNLYDINGRQDHKLAQLNLATCCFSIEDNKKAIDILNQKFNLPFSLVFDREYPMLYLNGKDNLNRFKDLISPYVIPSMQYKINHPTSFLISSPEETERNDIQ
jgi:recombination protein RecA